MDAAARFHGSSKRLPACMHATAERSLATIRLYNLHLKMEARVPYTNALRGISVSILCAETFAWLRIHTGPALEEMKGELRYLHGVYATALSFSSPSRSSCSSGQQLPL